MLLGATAALVPYAEAYYAVYFGLFALLYSATALWGLQLRVEGRNRRTASRVFFVLAALAAAAALAIALTPDTALDIASVRISLRSPDNALTLAWACLAAGALTRWRIRATVTRRPTPAPRHDLTDGTTGRAPQTGRLAAIPPVTVPSVTILSVAVPVVIAAVLAAPLAVPAWTLWRSGDYVTQPSSLKSSPRGVDAATLVMGPPFSGIVGTSVRRAYARYGIDAMESSAWLGLAPLILLVLALRAAPRNEKTRGREEPRRDEEPWCNEEIRRWAVIGGAFGLWALGPYLTVLGHNTGLLLPEALARAIPIVNNARMPARAMALVAVAAAVVGAVAVARRRPSRASTWALSSVAALALLETLAAPLPLVAVPAPGVYARLAAGPSAGAVLTLPFGVRDGFLERGHMEHDALLGQTVHGRPLVGGFLARLSPRVWTWYESTEPFAALLALSEGGSPDTLPTCAAVLAGLREASVSTVIVYPNDMPPRLAAFVSSHMPLTRVDSDDTRVVYNIDTAGCMP
jgi:hypothetical protein